MYDERELGKTTGNLGNSPVPSADPPTPPATEPGPARPDTPRSAHHPWNAARAVVATVSVALALVFALGALMLGNPLLLITTCTLVLVGGILWMLVPRESRGEDPQGGDVKFIVRLFQALAMLFGGGSGTSGGGGLAGGGT